MMSTFRASHGLAHVVHQAEPQVLRISYSATFADSAYHTNQESSVTYFYGHPLSYTARTGSIAATKLRDAQ